MLSCGDMKEGLDVFLQGSLELLRIIKFFPRHCCLNQINQFLCCGHTQIGCEKDFLQLIQEIRIDLFLAKDELIQPACEPRSRL